MSSLHRLERKTKNSLNAFRIRIFLFLSYSFGTETINTFISPKVPSKTILDSRPKWAKCIPVFRPKRPKNHPLRAGTYLYGLYKGVLPGGRVDRPSIGRNNLIPHVYSMFTGEMIISVRQSSHLTHYFHVKFNLL